MLHKVLDTIRHMNHHKAGFEAYLENLQRNGTLGAVGVDEARKDFRAVARRDSRSTFI